MPPMEWIWLAALVIFAILEAATSTLVSLWFIGGSLTAMISALCGADIWLQILLFCVVSAAAILLMRPMAKRLLQRDHQATNADRVLQMVGTVQEEIDNLSAKGLVKVDGKVWTARSLTGEIIPAGAHVQPMSIEGAKLMVCPVKEEQEANR